VARAVRAVRADAVVPAGVPVVVAAVAVAGSVVALGAHRW